MYTCLFCKIENALNLRSSNTEKKFLLRANFHGQASPRILNPRKFVHEELVTVITVGDSYPRKLIPLKI